MVINGELNKWVRNVVLTGILGLLVYFANGTIDNIKGDVAKSGELAVKAIMRTSEQATEIAVIKARQDEAKESQAEIKSSLKEVNDKVDRMIELQWQTLSSAKRLENR